MLAACPFLKFDDDTTVLTEQFSECIWTVMGNSRKYPYPTTDGFHVLTPPCLRKFQNALPPMPSEFHNHEPPPLQNVRF